MAVSDKVLHSDFIVELCKTCLSNTRILGVCQQELKYIYLENQSQKKVFKFIYETFEVTQQAPTVGVIGQQYHEDGDVINFLAQVKKADKITEERVVLEQLTDHIKKIRFKQLLVDVTDLFNKQQREQAYLMLEKQSEEIASFVFNEKTYGTVFEDYEQRQENRIEQAALIESAEKKLDKIPFGIHQLDDHTGGGGKRGTSGAYMATSGGGKSTALRWTGLHNARLGHRVVHFQLEGSEQDCYDLYDSAWTGSLTEEMALGRVNERQKLKIEKARRDILAKGGEIYVYASESFDALYIEDAREILLDIQTNIGDIDLIIFDYAELANVRGNYSGEAGERRRRSRISEAITNLAIEFDAFVLTATQAKDIDPNDKKNPNFRLTRHHISEFKGFLKPFSYFLTINGTSEMQEQGIAILYGDKFRHHRSGVSFNIHQALDRGKFYDAKKTINEFYTQ